MAVFLRPTASFFFMPFGCLYLSNKCRHHLHACDGSVKDGISLQCHTSQYGMTLGYLPYHAQENCRFDFFPPPLELMAIAELPRPQVLANICDEIFRLALINEAVPSCFAYCAFF